MEYAAIFAILGGAFSIFCAVKDYDWFMNNRRARPFVQMFGRQGARAFYIFLGAILLFVGLVWKYS